MIHPSIFLVPLPLLTLYAPRLRQYSESQSTRRFQWQKRRLHRTCDGNQCGKQYHNATSLMSEPGLISFSFLSLFHNTHVCMIISNIDIDRYYQAVSFLSLTKARPNCI